MEYKARSAGKFSSFKKEAVCLVLIGIMLLSGCGSDKVIGTAYGAECEHIKIGNDTYTICENPGVNKNSDRGDKLGVVVVENCNEEDPITVWSIKGYENNEYIYTLWLYEGAYYKKDGI